MFQCAYFDVVVYLYLKKWIYFESFNAYYSLHIFAKFSSNLPNVMMDGPLQIFLDANFFISNFKS